MGSYEPHKLPRIVPIHRCLPDLIPGRSTYSMADVFGPIQDQIRVSPPRRNR